MKKLNIAYILPTLLLALMMVSGCSIEQKTNDKNVTTYCKNVLVMDKFVSDPSQSPIYKFCKLYLDSNFSEDKILSTKTIDKQTINEAKVKVVSCNNLEAHIRTHQTNADEHLNLMFIYDDLCGSLENEIEIVKTYFPEVKIKN